MPSTLLATGVGAAEGLENLLIRKLKERELARLEAAQAETARANKADEVIRGRQVDETAAARREATAARVATTNAGIADDIRSRAQMRPIGAPVPAAEFSEDTAAGVPMGNFLFGSPGKVPLGSEAGAKSSLPMVEWKGTQNQIQAAQNMNSAPAPINDTMVIDGRPEEVLLDRAKGTVTLIRTGEDVTARAQHYMPPPTNTFIQTTGGLLRAPTRGGGPATPVTDASGNPIDRETADMQNKRDARDRLIPGIRMVKGLADKLINLRGIAQRAQAAGQSVEAALGNNPEYRAYNDARKAAAGNLAIMTQGSRPSDADIMAVWLPMIPSVFNDTDESNQLKWRMLEVLGGFGEGTVTGPAETAPGAVPEVGSTFQGGRVLRVTPIP